MYDDINVRSMLDAGVHFGHNKSIWNPKMSPYISGISKNNTHVIDLMKSTVLLKLAFKAVQNIVSQGGRVLFVGTKLQSANIIEEQAKRCGQYYIKSSWPSGLLTNWNKVSSAIKKIVKYEKTLSNEEELSFLKKKEVIRIQRKYDKITRTFEGIRNMGGFPDIIFIVDTNQEKNAINEANKLGIPVIAIVDSNSDPSTVQYPIPGNDDSVKSIEYFCTMIADACLVGISSEDKFTDDDVNSNNTDKNTNESDNN